VERLPEKCQELSFGACRFRLRLGRSRQITFAVCGRLFNWLTRRTDRLTGLRARRRRFAPPGWRWRSSKRESTTVTESTAGRRHQHSPTSLAGGARRPAARSRGGLRFRRISAPRCPRIGRPNTCAETGIRLARRLMMFLELAMQSPRTSCLYCMFCVTRRLFPIAQCARSLRRVRRPVSRSEHGISPDSRKLLRGWVGFRPHGRTSRRSVLGQQGSLPFTFYRAD